MISLYTFLNYTSLDRFFYYYYYYFLVRRDLIRFFYFDAQIMNHSPDLMLLKVVSSMRQKQVAF